MSTRTDKIRGALEKKLDIYWPLSGPMAPSSDESAVAYELGRQNFMKGANEALAALSELETQPKEGLSDAEIERHADELYPNIPEIPKQQEDRETFVLHFQYIRDKGLLTPSVDVRGLVEAGNAMRNVCNWIARELVHPKLELTRHGDMEAFISLCKQWDTAKANLSTQTPATK